MTNPGTSQVHAQHLADTLVRAGHLTPDWKPAFADTPREWFLPAFYQQTHGDWNLLTPETLGEEDWRELVYRDVTWVQRLDGPHHQPGTPAASCIRPSLAAQMISALPADPSSRVCEIGSGTGWLTAILSHHYTTGTVIGIELDPDLSDHARTTLGAMHRKPTLITTDGTDGYAAHAPYDAFLSTAATTHIPHPWIRQTRPGGTIVTPFRGAVAILTITGPDSATGRFLPDPVAILPLRTANSPAPASHCSPHALRADRGRRFDNAPALWDHAFRFFLNLRNPQIHIYDQELLGQVTVADTDGAQFHVSSLGTLLAAPTDWPLVDRVTKHLQQWREAGQPHPGKLTLQLDSGSWWANSDAPNTHSWSLS